MPSEFRENRINLTPEFAGLAIGFVGATTGLVAALLPWRISRNESRFQTQRWLVELQLQAVARWLAAGTKIHALGGAPEAASEMSKEEVSELLREWNEALHQLRMVWGDGAVWEAARAADDPLMDATGVLTDPSEQFDVQRGLNILHQSRTAWRTQQLLVLAAVNEQISHFARDGRKHLPIDPIKVEIQ